MAKRESDGASRSDFRGHVVHTSQAHPVGSFRLELAIEELLQRNPLAVVLHFLTPGAYAQETLNVMQACYKPLGKDHDRGCYQQHDDSLHGALAPIRNVCGGAEEAGKIGKLAQPRKNNYRKKAEALRQENPGMVCLRCHVVILQSTAGAIDRATFRKLLKGARRKTVYG